MHFWYQIFISVAIIFHTCAIVNSTPPIVLVLANESANCDCDVLQVDDPDGLIGYQNFTKQNETRNGKPIYFSTQRNMIYWNKDYWSVDKYNALSDKFEWSKNYAAKSFSFEKMCKKVDEFPY